MAAREGTVFDKLGTQHQACVLAGSVVVAEMSHAGTVDDHAACAAAAWSVDIPCA